MESKEVKFGEVADLGPSVPGGGVGNNPFSMAATATQVYGGITYRQWLIGQALAGVATMDPPFDAAASDAIQLADAVIAMLDAETAKDTKTADMLESGHQCCGGCK